MDLLSEPLGLLPCRKKRLLSFPTLWLYPCLLPLFSLMLLIFTKTESGLGGQHLTHSRPWLAYPTRFSRR